MGVILGIIGGGQLGMMLAEAAKNMPNEISKVNTRPRSSCTHTGASQLQDFDSDALILHG